MSTYVSGPTPGLGLGIRDVFGNEVGEFAPFEIGPEPFGGVELGAYPGSSTTSTPWVATVWAATNFTLFESCRLVQVESRAWLRAVIARIHAGDRNYASMTPAAYAAKAATNT